MYIKPSAEQTEGKRPRTGPGNEVSLHVCARIYVCLHACVHVSCCKSHTRNCVPECTLNILGTWRGSAVLCLECSCV